MVRFIHNVIFMYIIYFCFRRAKLTLQKMTKIFSSTHDTKERLPFAQYWVLKYKKKIQWKRKEKLKMTLM